MIIHIDLCDCCGSRVRGVGLTRFCIDDGRSFDVCDWCQKERPFRVMPSSERGVALQKVIDLALGAQ